MICKRCGAKFSDGIFCPECGSRIVSVSVFGGEEQTNTWENALQYSDEDGYNTKMYGPQGQLGELSITAPLEINAAGQRCFENKKLILKNKIRVGDNAKLEFRNCEIITEESNKSIILGVNVNVIFEGCVMKTKKSQMLEWSTNGNAIKFLNCAFVDGSYSYLSFRGDGSSVYFDNCFFKVNSIAQLRCLAEVEFRSCVIVNDENGSGLITVRDEATPILIFENCFIKSNTRLIRNMASNNRKIELRIRNSYIDNYSGIYWSVADQTNTGSGILNFFQ